MSEEVYTFEQMMAYYRAKFDTDKSILLRPGNYNFIESTKKEMYACLDELERHALTGEPLSPLQILALELIIPDNIRAMEKTRAMGKRLNI